MSEILPNLFLLFRAFGKKNLLLGILFLPLLVEAQTANFSISLSSHCGNGTATFTYLSGPK